MSRSGAFVVSALLGLAVLLALRLPTNRVPILNVDEADFAVEAGALLDGGRPYVDFVEKKPPLIHIVYAGALALVGRYNLPGFRLLLVGYVLASALLLASIARRLYGDRAALVAVPAYALAVSAGPPMDLHAANPETLFLLPLLAGTRLGLPQGAGDLRPGALRLFASGVCIGLAALIKQQAGMQLAILIAFVCFERRPGESDFRGRDLARRVAALIAGFGGIWLVALGALAAVGSLREFIYWTFEVNRYYVAHGNTLRDGAARLWDSLRGLAAVLPALWILGLAGLLRELTATGGRRRLLPLLWFAGSLVPIVLGGRFFGHYFLQLLPVLALTAAGMVAELWGRAAAHRTARVFVCATAGLLVLLQVARKMAPFHDSEALSVPHAVPQARALASFVRDHTPRDARIVVWGYGSAIYHLAERRPATRFPYVTYLVGAVEGTPAWWSPFHPSRPLEIDRAWDLFFEDLERHPPALVIDTSRPGYFAFQKFRPAKYPRLMRYLEAGFEPSGEVAGFPIWWRRDRYGTSGHIKVTADSGLGQP